MSGPSKNPPQVPTGRDIMMRFYKLREELKDFANKLSAIELECNEHKMALETLDQQDPDRKCYRQCGQYLIESTVKEASPVVRGNKDKLDNVKNMLLQAIEKKNKEIDEYRDKYNIITQMQQDKAKKDAAKETKIESLPTIFADNFKIHMD